MQYTDSGPEHRTDFLSVNIVVSALQKSLNADMIAAFRIAASPLIQKSTRKNQSYFEYPSENNLAKFVIL